MKILWNRKTGISFYFFAEIVACVSIYIDKTFSAKPDEHDFWIIATASNLAYSFYLLCMYSNKNGELDEWNFFKHFL